MTLAASISDFSPASHWSCDELSGVRYDSQSVNTNDLTDNNTVLYQTGLRGNACDFEKSASEYLSITDADQTSLEGNTFSVSFWFKFESSPTDERPLSKWNNTSSQQSYEAYITSSAVGIQWYTTSNVNGWNQANYTISTATWYHYVATVDAPGSSAKVYINGVLATTTSSNYPSDFTVRNSSSAFNLGARSSSAIYFDGLIDEITFFNTVLTQGNVTTLYNGGTPLPYSGTVSNLVPVVISDRIDTMLQSVICSATSTSTACSYSYASTTIGVTPHNVVMALVIFIIFFVGGYWLVRKLT